MLAPSIHDNDQMSRGCQPSGAAVRLAAISPENPASATPSCAMAMSRSACGIRLPACTLDASNVAAARDAVIHARPRRDASPPPNARQCTLHGHYDATS